MITWIVTHLAKLPIWGIWLAILFSVTCVFVIWDRIDTWRLRHKKGITKFSDRELGDTIREWLDIPSLSFKRLVAESELSFKFLITDNGQRSVNIFRSKKNPSMIQIGAQIPLTPSNQSMNQERWEYLARKLSVEMARLGIEFMFNGEPNQLERIRLLELVIIDDSLTGFYFRQRLFFVIRACILVLIIAKDTFEEIGVIEPVVHKEGSQS